MSFDEKIFIDAQVKRVVDHIAGEEREQCCKDICELCRNGDKPWKHGGELQGYAWFHNDPNGYFIEPGIRASAYCKASPIRKRAAKE